MVTSSVGTGTRRRAAVDYGAQLGAKGARRFRPVSWRRRLMPHARRIVLALAVALAGTSLVACTETPKRESTGQYIDDAAITTKVKAALVKDQSLDGVQIGVEHSQNV